MVKKLREGEGFKLGDVATIRVSRIERNRVAIAIKAPTLQMQPLPPKVDQKPRKR